MEDAAASGSGVVTEAELNRIRAKYFTVRADAEGRALGSFVPAAPSGGSAAARATVVSSAGKLDKLRICKACEGSGMARHLYNHIILERTCENCEGDGVCFEFSQRARADETVTHAPPMH